MENGLFHLLSVPPCQRTSGILQGTSKVYVEFFRVLVKLMWNSSGYYEVDVEFFMVMPIIVMEFFRDKGFEILQTKGKVF